MARTSEVFAALDAAIALACQFPPFHDRHVGLEQSLLDPAAIVIAVKLLRGLARPDVVVVEAIQGELDPLVAHLLAERRRLVLVCGHATKDLKVTMRGGIDRNVPFKLIHSSL